MDLVIVPIVVINVVAAAVMAAVAVASRSADGAVSDVSVTTTSPSSVNLPVRTPHRPLAGKPVKQPAWTPGARKRIPDATGTESTSKASSSSFTFPDAQLEVRSIVDITGTDATTIPVVPMRLDGSLIGLVGLAVFTKASNAPRIEQGCRSLLGRMGTHAEPSSKMLVVAVDSLASLMPARMPSNRWTQEAKSVSVVVVLNDAWSTGPTDDLTFGIMLLSPKESSRSVRSALAPWLGESRRMSASEVTDKMQHLASLIAVAGPTRVLNAGAELSSQFLVALVAHSSEQSLGSAQAIMADLKAPALALLAQLARLPHLPRPTVLIAVAGSSDLAGGRSNDSANDVPVCVNWVFDPRESDRVRVWLQYPESTLITEVPPPASPSPQTSTESVSNLESAGASWFLDPVWDETRPVGNVVSRADLRRVVVGSVG